MKVVEKEGEDYGYSKFMANVNTLIMRRKLIKKTEKIIGEQTTLILLSAPTAMNYFPKVGFQTIANDELVHEQF